MPFKSKWTGRLSDHYISDLSMVDINEMKCWELVKELKSRGLPSSGNKNELINRLEKALADTDPGQFNADTIALQAGYYDDDSYPQIAQLSLCNTALHPMCQKILLYGWTQISLNTGPLACGHHTVLT